MLLTDTNRSLEVKLGGAIVTTQPTWTIAYVDITQATTEVFAEADDDGALNSMTAVVMAAAPAAGKTRQIKAFSVYNDDTAQVVVIVQKDHAGTKRRICKVPLEPGESLHYDG